MYTSLPSCGQAKEKERLDAARPREHGAVNKRPRRIVLCYTVERANAIRSVGRIPIKARQSGGLLARHHDQ